MSSVSLSQKKEDGQKDIRPKHKEGKRKMWFDKKRVGDEGRAFP